MKSGKKKKNRPRGKQGKGMFNIILHNYYGIFALQIIPKQVSNS